MAPYTAAVLLALCVAVAFAETSIGPAPQKLSKPGGAGHALLFQNHIAKVPSFKGFPTTEVTFEAWVSTTDFCHSGTILSYAKPTESHDVDVQSAASNHFVIFNSLNVIGCHDFTALSGTSDSCLSSYQVNKTGSLVTRDGSWRHIAVTWNAKANGAIKVYVDGSLMGVSASGKTQPLEAGGTLLLGQEQDCLGGCTDASQSFQGLMDEVRIWKKERSQDQIAHFMRWADGLENDADLVAYWKFNDPDNDDGNWRAHAVARDASGTGNDLVLVDMPRPFRADLGDRLHADALSFRGQYAHSWNAMMPAKDFTIEFWARVASLQAAAAPQQYNTLLDYATRSGDQGAVASMDDAIRIERYSVDYAARPGAGFNFSTVGAIGVHLNTNYDQTQGGAVRSRWIDFRADWLDDKWHHIAVTWDYSSGVTKLYMDGQEKPAFWRNNNGQEDRAGVPGFAPVVAPRTERQPVGSLVLGMDQDCYGGCFNPASPANSDMALLRVWNTARTQDQIRRNMRLDVPEDLTDCLFYYNFPTPTTPDDNWLESYSSGVTASEGLVPPIFFMYSPAPTFVYSTAPLTTSAGRPVPLPQPGQAGHALVLSDQAVVVAYNFHDFPSKALTVEFWMRSVDTCRQGTPISYSNGAYGESDNSFSIFDYNSLGVSVVQDQGQFTRDQNSGITITDGQWHHVAVTWESESGMTKMYVDTTLVWTAIRAQGKGIPPGGTLVIGREQDCLGGCFDSLPGAAGSYNSDTASEYGPQDFTGAIEQVRIWRTARSAEDIAVYYTDDALQRKLGSRHPDLVAHWEFDEGSGFRVEDLTGKGHDLQILSSPKFEVVKWLGVCGNGIVEGDEECDLRTNGPDTGCTEKCKVEHGWTCTLDPQVCTQSGPGTHPTPSRSHSTQSSRSGSHPAPASASHSGFNAWGIALGVLAALGVLGVAAFMGRHTLYEHVYCRLFPGSHQRYLDFDEGFDLAQPPRAMMAVVDVPAPTYSPLPQGP